MFTKTPDGSFIDDAGRVIYFSVERFVKDIVEGDCCFICGKKPSEVPFNEEHVLPDWIIKKYDLSSRKITLPNLHGFTYSQYKIPCCVACNELMGKTFEKPISDLISTGYAAVVDYLLKHGPRLIFVWLALIFLKTHLKDRGLRVSLDRRKDEGVIGDFYQWKELHHIHCIARSFYTSAIIEPAVYGTFVVQQAQMLNGIESFDFGDLYDLRCVLMRIEDTCFIVVLNDSQAAGTGFHKYLERLTGPLSPIQLREVLARLGYANHLLEQRPIYKSEIDHNVPECRIVVELPPRVIFKDINQEELGLVIYSAVHGILDRMANPDLAAIKEHVRKGKYTFLFDSNGDLISDSLILPSSTLPAS